MIGKVFTFIKSLFKNHKLKILASIVAFLLFVVIIFPYDDLADLVTSSISNGTNNQVFLQFDNLGLSIFPSPALEMENMELDIVSSPLPTLKSEQFTLAPSIAGFLSFRPGFTAHAQGFLKGSVDLTIKSGKKIESSQMQDLSLELNKIDLAELRELLNLAVPLEGKASGSTEMSIDPKFAQQPNGEFNFAINKLRIPPATIPTQLGPFSLPNVQVSNLNIKGRMAASELIIEETTIGSSDDPLNGRIRGKIGLNINPRARSIIDQLGSYELKIELNVKQSIQKDFGLFLSFFDKYKTPVVNGSRYAFRVSGASFASEPNLSALVE